MNSKSGIYKLVFRLHSWAKGAITGSNTPINSVHLTSGFEGPLRCYIPLRDGDFEPKSYAEIADIISLSIDDDIICCSDRMYALIQAVYVQPYQHRMITVCNTRLCLKTALPWRPQT